VAARSAYDFRVMRARCLCLLLVVGCATPMSSLRDDNRRLTDTVSELRGDRRAQERKVRDLQHQLDELKARSAVSEPVPALPVVIAAPAPAAPPPDGARVVGVADDGTEIVYEGAAMAAHPAALPALPGEDARVDEPRPSRRALPLAPAAPGPAVRTAAVPPTADVPAVADRIEVTRHVPPVSARAQRRSSPRDHEPPGDRGGGAGGRGDAAGDYRAAVELVKSAKYVEALAALREFVQRNPRHDYADNAQYWVGEVFYAQKDYVRALSEFRKVVEVYPRGNKVPDALLKVGYCYQAVGQGDKARAVLEQVVNRYPKSEPAALAARRLEAP
jgi:tol-pal system protein YbgF